MSMPVTSVNEDDGMVFAKEKVGVTWKPRDMQAKAKSSLMKAAPQQHFRPGVLAFDPGHHSGPRDLINDICHSKPLLVFCNLG